MLIVIYKSNDNEINNRWLSRGGITIKTIALRDLQRYFTIMRKCL